MSDSLSFSIYIKDFRKNLGKLFCYIHHMHVYILREGKGRPEIMQNWIESWNEAYKKFGL